MINMTRKDHIRLADTIVNSLNFIETSASEKYRTDQLNGVHIFTRFLVLELKRDNKRFNEEEFSEYINNNRIKEEL